MIGWVLGGAAAVVLLVAVRDYNRFVRLRNEAAQAWSGIDVQLRRRADLVPNLVEVVRGYAGHEAATLEAVTAARTATLGATTQEQAALADALMQGALTGMMGLAEQYPDLRASENFLLLQEQLTETEDRIASARRYNNAVVRRYNTLVGAIPDLLVARLFHFEELPYYRLEDDAEREPVAVAFTAPGATGGTA